MVLIKLFIALYKHIIYYTLISSVEYLLIAMNSSFVLENKFRKSLEKTGDIKCVFLRKKIHHLT